MAKKDTTEPFIRLGILGVGGIAQGVHLPSLKRFPDVKITALCDLDLQKAGLVAQKFGVPQFYQDPQRMFSNEDLDAVLILTPTNSHLALALMALEAGKHVFVERPMARTVTEAKKMLDVSKKADRLLMVAMNHRFRPDSMILKNFIEGGELGEVFMVRSGWLKKKGRWSGSEWQFKKRISGGGVLMDLGLQMLDLSLWLMDSFEVERIQSVQFHNMLGLEVEDTIACQLLLKGGRSLTLHASWALLAPETQAYSHFWGTKGAAVLNPLRIDKEMHGSLVNVTPEKSVSRRELYKSSFEFELRHFIECVKNNRPSMSSGEDAVKVLEIVDSIYKTARKG